MPKTKWYNFGLYESKAEPPVHYVTDLRIITYAPGIKCEFYYNRIREMRIHSLPMWWIGI